MLNLVPQTLNLPPVTTGDTYPAIQFLETLADTDLTRVRMKVKDRVSGATVLSLDSDTTGITITNATAGAWDYSIDRIDTITLAAGWYDFDIETTDDVGTITTEFSGAWQILHEVTD